MAEYRVTARDRLARWLADAALRLATRQYRAFVTVTNQFGRRELQRRLLSGPCWCRTCDRYDPAMWLDGDVGEGLFLARMNLCPDCGDKRCARAADHAYPCPWPRKSDQEAHDD